jgi:hypothetical protein
MKTFIFFIALLLSIYFVNDKFSKGVRVIAFSEGETENGAKISFMMMIVIAIAWTVFFALH